ncbi:MAG: hypothetical protein AAF530_05070 [Pseudomonadota bacterium]
MNTAPKFLFDLNFEAPPPEATELKPTEPDVPEPEEDLPPPSLFTQEDLEAAHQSGFHAGQEEARAEVLAGIEKQTVDHLTAIEALITQVTSESESIAAAQEMQSLKVMRQMSAKLFPALAQRDGLAEIERIIEDCMERLRDEPRLVIRTGDEALEPIRQSTKALAERKSFEGRLIFLSEPELGFSDVIVEWADGGASRELSALLAEIDEHFDTLLSQADTPIMDQPAIPASLDGSTEQHSSGSDIEASTLAEKDNG